MIPNVKQVKPSDDSHKDNNTIIIVLSFSGICTSILGISKLGSKSKLIFIAKVKNLFSRKLTYRITTFYNYTILYN